MALLAQHLAMYKWGGGTLATLSLPLLRYRIWLMVLPTLETSSYQLNNFILTE
jgi:hypothetical protein